MNERVTLFPADAALQGRDRISSALPPDLLDQVRGRVRLLALLIFIAFVFDPILFVGAWVTSAVFDSPLPDAFYATSAFQWVSIGAVAVSAGLWWAARSSRVSLSLLFTLGLAYEIAICFVLALMANWQTFIEQGVLPNLTWVPMLVILFPLILPGPPRPILGAAVASAATVPLSLVLLDLLGAVTVTLDNYVSATVTSSVAVFFAYMGARVVYGLGRQVAAARELGSYRLAERLGLGGMGEVWRAEHRMLARPAAIKLIRRPHGDDGRAVVSSGALQRFEREAQAIASLRSPHTVELFDFGVADDGAVYYVMELLEGLDTDELVRRYGPMPSERTVHFIRQICHSLSEAHSRGLVHRDIKPANIFLCRYGEECDFVKVLDFGLVKWLSDTVDTNAALTAANTVHGTPAFIAPEQALGRSDLDGRVDIYATGCVAYWLLTGQRVFTADTPMGLVTQHAHATPVAPSKRSELPIPAALDRLVLSCLAKDPAERPQSAKELSERLATIELADVWTEDQAREWWTIHEPGA